MWITQLVDREQIRDSHVKETKQVLNEEINFKKLRFHENNERVKKNKQEKNEQ